MKQLLLAVLCIACIPPDQAQYGQPGYGGQPGGQPGYAPQGPPPLACIPLLECLSGCGQNQACLPECMNRGDDASRAAVNTLLACNAATPNAGCEPELAACRAQTPVVAQQPPQQWQQPEQQPAVAEQMLPGQPHTTANILPWMVGDWVGNNYHYTFTADGHVKRASGIPLYTEKTGRYACASIVNEMGTVRQEGDLLIMEFAAAQENHCGDVQSAPALTVRNQIVWYQYSTLPVALKLIDIDCTRGLMYCSDPIKRR